MTDQKTTASPSWDKHQKAQWGKLVRTGDWAGAVAFAQDPGFTAADFTRRVPMGPQVGPWGESRWFEKCRDAQALESMLDRVGAAPSLDSRGAPRPFLTAKGLAAAIGASNDAGLSILQKRAPKLFANKKALPEGLGILLSSDDWVQADAAPALRARLVGLQKWFPDFDAKKLIASWGSPEAFYRAAMGAGPEGRGNPGRAAVARLAFEEAGLDPWAMADLTSGSRAPARLALMTLDRETPDLFFEFVRAGVSPDALRLEADPVGQQVLWPQGVFGTPWMELEWPEGFDTKPPRSSPRPMSIQPAPGLNPIMIMTRHNPEMRPGLSAREVIEAAIVAKPVNSMVTVIRHMERFSREKRQGLWRAGWEAHCLREAMASAAAPLAGGAASVTNQGLGKEEPASNRGAEPNEKAPGRRL